MLRNCYEFVLPIKLLPSFWYLNLCTFTKICIEEYYLLDLLQNTEVLVLETTWGKLPKMILARSFLHGHISLKPY